ncbi:nucleoside deaminase, Fcy1p [Histoplasma capsulatum var. duboisii H88]|uniref:Nucleoside deaminase, Fcy1p n=1 Tax=Ajellomyces capsulatus (strain H88) TaxID=544711 RepID=A0A8A1LIX1_AJEC8|nr:nucleoside deaminase, Fcy1p [Histoplasma capsulatum var. duboisii H88]
MRKANQALPDLGSPCPWAAFGSVVVNHTTAEELGDLICSGVNENLKSGNPVSHGEIAAITNCTDILTNKDGRFKLTSLEALEAFKEFTLYTNAESCPMCAAAIRWAGFKEYLYGTSMETLIRMGWPQIRISSREVFEHSTDLPSSSNIIGGILMNETDTYFAWQFDPSSPCPRGCDRPRAGRNCRRSERRPGFCYQKGLTWMCRVSDVIKSYIIDSGISLKTLVS